MSFFSVFYILLFLDSDGVGYIDYDRVFLYLIVIGSYCLWFYLGEVEVKVSFFLINGNICVILD